MDSSENIRTKNGPKGRGEMTRGKKAFVNGVRFFFFKRTKKPLLRSQVPSLKGSATLRNKSACANRDARATLSQTFLGNYVPFYCYF